MCGSTLLEFFFRCVQHDCPSTDPYLNLCQDQHTTDLRPVRMCAWGGENDDTTKSRFELQPPNQEIKNSLRLHRKYVEPNEQEKGGGEHKWASERGQYSTLLSLCPGFQRQTRRRYETGTSLSDDPSSSRVLKRCVTQTGNTFSTSQGFLIKHYKEEASSES